MSATQIKSQTKFIDFQALKQGIKIEDAMPLLGLKVSQFSDQMRGACPACKSGGDRALVITACVSACNFGSDSILMKFARELALFQERNQCHGSILPFVGAGATGFSC